jgi:hypothetical protein
MMGSFDLFARTPPDPMCGRMADTGARPACAHLLA